MNTTVEIDKSLQADALELHEALADLLRIYQFRDRSRICCHDISVTQCYALEALLQKGPMTLNTLAGKLYLDKSTASRVVDSLVRKGYVTRSENPDDARALRLEVTNAGEHLYSVIRRDLVAEVEEMLAEFDPDVRQATIRLMSRLARTAIDKFSQPRAVCISVKCRT